MLIGIDGNEANITRRVGVNQYAFDLLHALHDLPETPEFVIYLKSPPLPDLPAARPGWSYRVIPFPKLWTQTRLPFDLYTHFPRPDVFFTPSHYAPRWSPMPAVISVMDLGFLSTRSQFTAKDFNQLKHWTEYSVARAAKVLAISEFTRQDVIKFYHRRPEDVIVTHLAYDDKMFKPVSNPAVLKKFGITGKYFLFLSSLKPSKNVEGLIRAYHQFKLSSAGPVPKLVIAGKKAWLFDQIFALVKDLQLEADVIFTGFVAETDVPPLMTQSAAFILPSFFEGFGIPVLEAMACGTPVVVSRVASLPEVAGSAGIYIDPYNLDSICAGLTEALGKNRRKYITAGLTQVRQFSWVKTAQKTLEVLTSC